MRARSLLLTAAAALSTVALAVLPTSATAMTPALYQTLSLGQPSGVDGVVTSWQIQGAAGQTVKLLSRQMLGGGGSVTMATSSPVAVTASPQTIASRQAIPAGGTLALDGATGSPTVTATVEPDFDGDAYGDTTQDACQGNALDHTAPCDGTTTIGSPLFLQSDTSYTGGGSDLDAVQLSALFLPLAAPSDGILVRFRFRTAPGKGDTVFQLLRPTTPGGGTYTVIAETDPVHETTNVVSGVATRWPVKTGDRIAFRAVDGDPGPLAASAGDAAELAPARTTGQTWTPDTTTPEAFRLLVQADIEPDDNNNGRGDISQESADLQVTGSAPAEALTTDNWTQAYTVRNAGPDDALGVVVTFGTPGLLAGPGDAPSCQGPSGAAASCAIGTLKAGASTTVSPVFMVPAIFPPLPGTFRTTATAYATTSDPNPNNNAASLTTVTRRAGPPSPPPVVKLTACQNVVRGTRDDDVVRGTAFPDRLVAGDGNDLLKGLGADDCLEAGAGDDVLDGGDGSDRLSGASGKDRLIGGKGDDKLTGGKGNDRLSAGAGNDALSPGAGTDRVDAGSGNDTINAVDGVRETIECGSGKDTVRADQRDRLKHCEKVTRKR